MCDAAPGNREWATLSIHDFKVSKAETSLRYQVIMSIRHAIVSGVFSPGQRLPEKTLCEMTGVSRTLVREALRQLESERLIQVIPHRGPFVAEISPEEARSIYQLRAELEGLASELFAGNAGDAERAALREAFEGIRKAYASPEATVKVDAKNRFYECLFDGAGNEPLAEMLRMVNTRVSLLRAKSLQAPGRTDDSLAELQSLMEALDARDPDRARAVSRDHVVKAGEKAISVLEKERGSS